jgi:hypothetical protein
LTVINWDFSYNNGFKKYVFRRPWNKLIAQDVTGVGHSNPEKKILHNAQARKNATDQLGQWHLSKTLWN